MNVQPPNRPLVTRSKLAETVLTVDGKRFSLHDYPFFRDVYDVGHPEVLLKTARQIAKSCLKTSTYLLANGSVCKFEDAQVGHETITLLPDGAYLGISEITWKSEEYTKSCLEIETRLGHIIRVATTHPVRCWESWVEAGKLRVGDRVATVRRAGVFTGKFAPSDEEVKFIAYMIGDGSCVDTQLNFTKSPDSPTYQDFIASCERLGLEVRTTKSPSKKSHRLSPRPIERIRTLLKHYGLHGKYAEEKHIPELIFDLDRRQTALFLNRLFSTDGSAIRTVSGTNLSIEYSTISETLALGVRRLLWKFGILSKKGWFKPNVYEGTDKRAYKIRIETQEGLRTFLDEIGILGKTESVRWIDAEENNNRDTFPKEINSLIRRIDQTGGRERRGCASNKQTLFAKGLRKTLSYPPTRVKIRKYVDCFRQLLNVDQNLVDVLEAHAHTDLYWDRIVSIKDIGKQPCYDISVKGTGNFVTEGVVTHNSTYCANSIITASIVTPHFKTLYVSPTKEQTSKFSNTRLQKIIYYSPMIYDNFYDSRGTHNVLLQILKNGSEVSLSYADDDPDRIRGISADQEFLDEVQDIVYDAVVPVVKECMANSDYGFITYAGTPKTMDNTIEFLWKHSSQSEWIMKCAGCGSWQFVDSARSIGMRGIICVKCGHALNPRSGKWYNFNPMADIKGFHISQPILPKNNEVPERWKRILQKMQIYSETKFKNEVLGVSDAIGSRCINQEDLIILCDPEYFVTMPVSPRLQQGLRTVVAGVDWGGGSDSRGAVSRTVLWVFGLTEDYKHKTLFFKVFSEENPSANVDEIAEICQQIGVKYVVGDAGGGAIANSRLRDILSPHRVGQSQYGGGGQGVKLIRWSPQANRFLVNRTAVIDSYILAIKNHEVIYPNVRQMAVPIQDILNVYEERVMSGLSERRIWTHAPTAPDDCLHAQVYAWLAMKIVRGEVEFFYEMRDTEWQVA